MTKAALRRIYKQKRLSLTKDFVDEKSLEIANQILKLDIWNKTYYHCFLSIEKHNEINTEYLLHILQGKDKQVVVSKSNFSNHSMEHFLLTDSTRIYVNKYGIPEPLEGVPVPNKIIDVVFVPLLAFDKDGHRVGYGKGFYDQFLSSCRPETIKIGLSLFQPIEKIEDSYSSDISLDKVITPQNIYSF